MAENIGPSSLCIHVLNVGDGDNIIIQSPEVAGNRLYGVVDCYKPGKTIKYLNKLEVNELEFVCATHPHFDHIKGIPAILKEYKGRISQFWDSGFRHKSNTYQRIIDLVSKDKNIRFMRVTSGFENVFNNVKISALAPSINLRNRYETYGVDINDASIVLKFDYSRFKGKKGSVVILAADAQSESLRKICEEYPHYEKIRNPGQLIKIGKTIDPLKCQVLKVSHHRSKHDTTLKWIERLDPEHTVLSCTKERWLHELAKLALQEKMKKPNRIHCTYDKGSILIACYGSGMPRIIPSGDDIDDSPEPPQ